MCKKLLAAGFSPERPLYLYRGPQLCLIVRSLCQGCQVEARSRLNGGATLNVGPEGASIIPGREITCSLAVENLDVGRLGFAFMSLARNGKMRAPEINPETVGSTEQRLVLHPN